MSALDNYLRIHCIYCGVWEADGVPCSCDVEAARAELAALRAENEAMMKALGDVLRAWSFNDYQFHTHSWHTREDWIGRHPVVLEMARTLAAKEDGRG